MDHELKVEAVPLYSPNINIRYRSPDFLGCAVLMWRGSLRWAKERRMCSRLECARPVELSADLPSGPSMVYIQGSTDPIGVITHTLPVDSQILNPVRLVHQVPLLRVEAQMLCGRQCGWRDSIGLCLDELLTMSPNHYTDWAPAASHDRKNRTVILRTARKPQSKRI